MNHVLLAILDLFDVKESTPYDYMNSVDRFEEISLPTQDSFFNKLSGSSCSYSEYAHVTRVWDAFGCETIADYHDLYLQLDVLLLADFFEKFRRTTILHLVLNGMLHSLCQMLISGS